MLYKTLLTYQTYKILGYYCLTLNYISLVFQIIIQLLKININAHIIVNQELTLITYNNVIKFQILKGFITFIILIFCL